MRIVRIALLGWNFTQFVAIIILSRDHPLYLALLRKTTGEEDVELMQAA